jgi:hypothetical protein
MFGIPVGSKPLALPHDAILLETGVISGPPPNQTPDSPLSEPLFYSLSYEPVI